MAAKWIRTIDNRAVIQIVSALNTDSELIRGQLSAI